ncbi:MAG: GNAT family N-acetyltransferase [Succinivibrionaceae bacterium]|nr:GNAT family N-acetyltransferase [Succinivibrionaceae bacterium]
MEFETLSWDNYVFRQVTRDDCNIVHELLLELCDYENLHTEFKSTPEDLENILFNLKCGDAILVYDNESDEYIGVILLSYNYSTFKGKPGIFIEDFYIREDKRGIGIGTFLFKYMMRVAKENGFGRIDWVCLKNNKPSIEFYEKLNAKQMPDWVMFRLDEKEFE